MTARNWWAEGSELPGAPGMRSLTVSANYWSRAAQELAAGGARLLALWASRADHGPPYVHAAFLINSGAVLLKLQMTDAEARYPGLEGHFPCAARMQRAIADLSGVHATDPDARAWLRHNAWPPDFHPL